MFRFQTNWSTSFQTMYLNASTQKVSRSNNDYMNTRNAFVGLEENLRALVPNLESTNHVLSNNSGSEKKLNRGTRYNKSLARQSAILEEFFLF